MKFPQVIMEKGGCVVETTKKVRAIDTLRIHFTTLGHVYDVLDEDEECFKVLDDRGRENWIPFRYLEVVEEEQA